MKKIKEILERYEEFTMSEFWTAVDDLPDEVTGRKHKKNIHAYFKQDGTPKTKALTLNTQEDYQTMHHTLDVIRRMVALQMHVNKLRERCSAYKKSSEDRKENKLSKHKRREHDNGKRY